MSEPDDEPTPGTGPQSAPSDEPPLGDAPSAPGTAPVVAPTPDAPPQPVVVPKPESPEPVAPSEPMAPMEPPAAPEPILVPEAEPEPEPPAPEPPAPSVPEVVASKAASSTNKHSKDEDDYDDDDDWDEATARDAQASRWVSMVTTIGIGIVSVVGLQVLMSLIEGISLRGGERFSTVDVPIADDLLHRLGYPFGGLGATAQLFLIIGVVLISLPPVLGGRLTSGQYRATGIFLRVATVLAVIVAVGSLLAVRGSLHEYTAKNVAVPPYVRVQFTNFLLGTLAGSALAIFCSLAAHPLRHWER